MFSKTFYIKKVIIVRYRLGGYEEECINSSEGDVKCGPLPNDNILDWLKIRAFADIKQSVGQMMELVSFGYLWWWELLVTTRPIPYLHETSSVFRRSPLVLLSIS